MTDFVSFVEHNIPSITAFFFGAPLSLFWSFLCLFSAGYLKEKKGLKTGYSRKIFHFLIFMTVSLIHIIWGTGMVLIFGCMTSLVIFYVILKGDGHPLYEAIAREKDRPHRTHFIIAPYFATLIGGIASNLLFGELAIVGYLVTGLGDAIGEPFGTRFGKHLYRVPSLRGVRSTRSYEGSAAVFITCLIAIALGIWLSPLLSTSGSKWLMVPLLGFVCMILEAVSPHGWDNATLQILPTYLAKIWF